MARGTRIRAVRVDDPLWDAARVRTAQNGTTISAVIVEALRRYVASPAQASPNNSSPVVVDLFAGPGGWDVAAARLGLAPLGVEWNAWACATARAAGHRRLEADVSLLDPVTVTEGAEVAGVIGSPPCQSWTLTGKGAGRRGLAVILEGVARIGRGEDARTVAKEVDATLEDDRVALILEPLRWALDLNPEWVALEQVSQAAPVFHAMADVLHRRGYSVDVGILSSEQYGLAQTRRRAFLVASRTGTVSLPAATHRPWRVGTPRTGGDQTLIPWRTMREALGAEITGVRQRSNYSAPQTATARTAAERGRTMRSLDEPSVVMTSKTAQWLHEATGRTFKASVVQAGLLQGFPADYPWQGPRMAQRQQVGDAVPPPMAEHVLRAAMRMDTDALGQLRLM